MASPSPSPLLGSPSSSRSSLHLAPPPPYTFTAWHSDPRASSTQSLAPSIDMSEDGVNEYKRARRTLLVIYIHGYNGNNRSFKSFPAHIHNYLREALADSHRVHSKIYPRYKTYRAIEVGVENFSEWLASVESEETDVVLVGHSMGGILAAEVVLMQNRNPYSRHPYKHRILGVVAMDTPYIGLHPGIVSAGIASLFRPYPEKQKTEAELNAVPQGASTPDLHPRPSTSTSHSGQTTETAGSSSLTPLTSPSQTYDGPPDPLFDPRWANDTVYKERPFFKGLAHFTKKHFSEGVFNAAAKHILSHMEYAHTLIDYPAMNARYENLRRLEDVDDLKEFADPEHVEGPSFRPKAARVRFVNYFTISTGFPKRPKPQKQESAETTHLKPDDAAAAADVVENESQGSTPRISVEDPEGATSPAILESPTSDIPEQADGKQIEDKKDVEEEQKKPEEQKPKEQQPENAPGEDPDAGLPTIPPLPNPPPPLELDPSADKETRKQAEKDQKRIQKTYEQALKAHTKALKERDKILEKRRRKAAKDAERREKEALKAAEQRDADISESAKPRRERKFCSLPKGPDGERDSAWVSVFMRDVDEVGAHCGLFVPGEHYDRLVGDVGGRIVGWVQEDLSRRAIARMMEGE